MNEREQAFWDAVEKAKKFCIWCPVVETHAFFIDKTQFKPNRVPEKWNTSVNGVVVWIDD